MSNLFKNKKKLKIRISKIVDEKNTHVFFDFKSIPRVPGPILGTLGGPRAPPRGPKNRPTNFHTFFAKDLIFFLKNFESKSLKYCFLPGAVPLGRTSACLRRGTRVPGKTYGRIGIPPWGPIWTNPPVAPKGGRRKEISTT